MTVYNVPETIINKKYRIEKVAPEGAWGYLVGIGLTLPMACGLASLHSFGLMYNEFLASVGAETSAVTIVTGTFFFAMSFGSLFASPLFKKYSMRSVGVVGAFIYFFGSLTAAFVTSVGMLIFSFGVLQGFGLGLMIPVSYTTFNHYFVKKRVFAMSVAQALKGVIITSHPILVKILMNEYGFRGTVAMIAAINAHGIFGMLAMHPIEWHYKIIKVPEVELELLMSSDNKNNENETKINVKFEEENNQTELPNETQKKHSVSNGIQNVDNGLRSEDDMNLVKTESSKSLADPSQFNQFDPIQKRIASIMSVSDFGGGEVVLRKSSESLRKGIWGKIVDFLDLTLMKDLIYVNIAIGISCGLFSDNIFTSILPLYLNSLGFPMDDTAWIVSTGTAFDLLSRVFVAIFSLFYSIKARPFFLIGLIALVFCRFVFLFVFSFYGMLVVMAFIGFVRTSLHIPMSLIFAEYLPSERFASGYGLFIFLNGNFTFILGPIVGWIRDVTHSYVIFNLSLQIISGFCIIPWIIEFIRFKKSSKAADN